MSNPNPYQPPQTPEPLKPTQVAKRGLGVAAILLLTPVAMFFAFFVNCFAAAATIDTSKMMGLPLPDAVIVTLFFAPPIIVGAAMVVWAVRAYRRDSRENAAS